MLHLAAIKAHGPGGKPSFIPEAEWRKTGKKHRPSTYHLINKLRRELWSMAIRPEISSGFKNTAHGHPGPIEFESTSAACCSPPLHDSQKTNLQMRILSTRMAFVILCGMISALPFTHLDKPLALADPPSLVRTDLRPGSSRFRARRHNWRCRARDSRFVRRAEWSVPALG